MMQKSISKPYKIQYKIDMPKNIGKVWTNYRKRSKMEPEGDPKVDKIHAKIDAWKRSKKVEKNNPGRGDLETY